MVIHGLVQWQIENGIDVPPGEAGDLGNEITAQGWDGEFPIESMSPASVSIG